MKYLVKFIFALLLISSLVFLHFIIIYLLPTPFSFLNIFVVATFLLFLIFESGFVIWIIIFSLFIIEHYNPTATFGILMFSGSFSTLISFWLYRFVFTNRSWYAGVTLTAIYLFIFRLLYCLISLFLVKIGTISSLNWSGLMIYFLWEFVFTCTTVGIIFFILPKLLPKFRTFTSNKNMQMFGLNYYEKR